MTKLANKRHLFLEKFKGRSRPLRPYEDIGEGIRLAFSGESKMRILTDAVPLSLSSHEDALRFSCDMRAADDWLSLEIDVDCESKSLNIHLRYAPSEQVYIAAIGLIEGKEFRVGLEDYSLPDHEFKLPIAIGSILPKFPTRPAHLRIMILFPNRPWFALGIREIVEER